MAYYVAGLMHIRETGWQAEYQQKLPAVIKRHGGEMVAVGGPDRLEGTDDMPDRMILMRFPTREAAQAWYTDNDHAPLIALRQSGATLNLFGVSAIA